LLGASFEVSRVLIYSWQPRVIMSDDEDKPPAPPVRLTSNR